MRARKNDISSLLHTRILRFCDIRRFETTSQVLVGFVAQDWSFERIQRIKTEESTNLVKYQSRITQLRMAGRGVLDDNFLREGASMSSQLLRRRQSSGVDLSRLNSVHDSDDLGRPATRDECWSKVLLSTAMWKNNNAHDKIRSHVSISTAISDVNQTKSNSWKLKRIVNASPARKLHGYRQNNSLYRVTHCHLRLLLLKISTCDIAEKHICSRTHLAACGASRVLSST